MSHPLPSSAIAKARTLVERMSLEEKATFCSGKNVWHLERLERLGIPSLMVTDGPHGLRKQGAAADHLGAHRSVPATCFPTASALASTWDVELIEEVGRALGSECVAEDVGVLLGPGMNIKRHPLCGRNFEYFSEDPLVTGRVAAALVEGIQSQGVGACLKHFAVNNQEHGRMYMDALVDPRTLHEIYLKGFQIAVTQAAPWSIMCAYNRVNGTYCSEHQYLLNEVLREAWGYQGLVMTDWGATNDRVLGVQAGLDLEMPGSLGVNDRLVLAAALEGGLKTEALDQAITRNVALALAAAPSPEGRAPADHQAHHALAAEAASSGAVLLKNDPSILPLGGNERVALIGAFAKKPRYQGAGSSQVRPTQVDTLFDALSAEYPGLNYAPGYDPRLSEPDLALIDEATALAAQADKVILYAGLPGIYESEGFDRGHMQLPAQHNDLIEAVAAVNPQVVVVLANGAPIEMPWIDRVASVLEGYLGGQASGSALADLLTGRRNPSGKLAETFPLKLEDVPAYTWFPGAGRQMQYREGLYVGYRYFSSAKQRVLFPFGHGLSYTEFDYQHAEVLHDTASDPGTVRLRVTLKNAGSLAGAEVVQVYRSLAVSTVHRPAQELVGFAKVMLNPGETQTLTLNLLTRDFATFDSGPAEWTIEPGTYDLHIGSSSQDIRLSASVRLNSGDSALSQAAQTVPAPVFNAPNQGQPLDVNDSCFAAMLGRPIPKPEASRPFHRNSSLAEISATWLGAKIRDRAVESFLSGLGMGEPRQGDETLRKMFSEMANHMPLRAMVLFQPKKLSYQRLDLLLALLNGHLFTAFRLWRQQPR